MRILNISLVSVLVFLFFTACHGQPRKSKQAISYDEPVRFAPPTYVCYQLNSPISIDGKLSPGEWDQIPWTTDFTDIEGDKRPAPYLQTRAKMAYDSCGMYFAALLEEPHVWATITQHDAVIFHDNDFEIFLNPSGDTHNYLEYEVNALGTVWDLYLSKPYRDGPAVLNNWEFMGMKSAVSVDGTLNNPNDTDKSWSVEVFIPWESIYQPIRHTKVPEAGEQIRVNFSRVQWTTTVENGQYKKIPMPGEEKIREHNWVWAPTGVIDIHRPEFWGVVQFAGVKAGETEVSFAMNPDEDAKWILRNLYYRQGQYRRTFEQYATQPSDLQINEVCSQELAKDIRIYTTPSAYEIVMPYNDKVWHIRQDGLVWSTAGDLNK